VNIPARLGYVPVNKAGDSMSGNVTMAGGSIAFNKVQDTEQHIEFLRDGATAANHRRNAIGLVRHAILRSGHDLWRDFRPWGQGLDRRK
jgi:hypothetical protein